MILVVDTHILIWYLMGDSRLSAKVKKVISDGKTDIVLPIICMAEFKHLLKRGKMNATLSQVQDLLASNPKLTVYPIDMDIIEEMPTSLDIHDSLIVATAILLKKTRNQIVALATLDEKIIASKLVPILK